MTNLIGFFVRRFVFAISIFTTIVFFGVISIRGIGVDLLPNFELSFVTVNTSYSGAGAEEVSKQISEPLEDSLATLPGISSLSSFSFEGLSVVFIEFQAGVNADQAAVDVSQRVNAIAGTLPEDAGSPSIQKLDPNDEPILQVAVTARGEDLRTIQGFAEDRLETELQQVLGVADVSVIGPVEREIQVLLDPGALELYGLTPSQIAGAISASSAELPLGNLTIAGERILLAGRNTPSSIKDVETLIVDPLRGLHVTDVAVVRDLSADINAYSRLNGEPVIVLEVLKQSGANSVATAAGVRSALAELDLPEGYQAFVVADTTPFISATFNDTLGELFRAVFIVALIVLLFLGRLGSTFSVILAIPISFAGALIIFNLFGFTFNIITLLAITVAVGLVVDDSIVIAESIDRYRDQGMSRIDAVRTGASEVSVAVLASTLSLLAVFLPISFLPGILGQFFREFGLTLTATIVASYLEALFFLTVRLAYLPNPELPGFAMLVRSPLKVMAALRGSRALLTRWWFWLLILPGNTALCFALLSGLLPASLPLAAKLGVCLAIALLLLPLEIYLGRIFFVLIGALLRPLHYGVDVLVSWMRSAYGATLYFLLGRSWVVLLTALLLFASVFVIAPRVGFNFTPAADSGQVGITLSLPNGTGLATTNDLASRIEARFASRPEIAVMLTNVGLNTSDIGNISSSGRAEFIFELVPKSERELSDRELALIYGDEAAALFPDVPEAVVTGYVIDNAGPPDVSAYSITLASNNLEILRERDNLARQRLESNPHLINLDSDLDTSVSERVFRLDQNALNGTGLSVLDVYVTLRAYNVGIEAAQLRDKGNEYPILVKINPAVISDEQSLLSLPVFSNVLGRGIPLSELGSFSLQEAPSTITRIGQIYTTEIRADVRPGSPAISTLRNEIKDDLIAAGVIDNEVSEAQGVGLDLTGDLIFYTPIAFALALILNYLVIASQFNSFKFPIYLLLTVPLALVGAIWLFFLTGTALDVNSVLGIVILTGLVTKNAILLLDIIVNQTAESERKPLRTMLVEAGKLRLRPILMTTTTLVAISIPLLLGSGEGSEFRRPLGMVIFAGVTTSALLTLFVIPSAFYQFERRKFDQGLAQAEQTQTRLEPLPRKAREALVYEPQKGGAD